MKFSVIIPILKVTDCFKQKAREMSDCYPDAEIIVVEAADKSQEPFWEGNICFLKFPKGRGLQCNAGAKKAKGEILFFLHADSLLPKGAFAALEAFFENKRNQVCCFQLRFDAGHWLFRIYEFFTRFDCLWTSFGDQGIIVRKSFFEDIGGFPDWPLFEDVEFLSRARQKTKIFKLPILITTSAVRYQKNGIVRQQIKNFWLLVRYCCGASAFDLAKTYDRERSKT